MSILAIILLAILGGYLWYQNNNLKQELFRVKRATSSGGSLSVNMTPEQEIAALEKQLQRLLELKATLEK
ncbi:MAG: hypothetical protein FJY91_01295 [Candidatus Harrisonbacteria bacterium]|nr:hypothetical protein [Candidatus Harrisonbacteria bacterium]